jgi:hypothetical protein
MLWNGLKPSFHQMQEERAALMLAKLVDIHPFAKPTGARSVLQFLPPKSRISAGYHSGLKSR